MTWRQDMHFNSQGSTGRCDYVSPLNGAGCKLPPGHGNVHDCGALYGVTASPAAPQATRLESEGASVAGDPARIPTDAELPLLKLDERDADYLEEAVFWQLPPDGTVRAYVRRLAARIRKQLRGAIEARERPQDVQSVPALRVTDADAREMAQRYAELITKEIDAGILPHRWVVMQTIVNKWLAAGSPREGADAEPSWPHLDEAPDGSCSVQWGPFQGRFTFATRAAAVQAIEEQERVNEWRRNRDMQTTGRASSVLEKASER